MEQWGPYTCTFTMFSVQIYMKVLNTNLNLKNSFISFYSSCHDLNWVRRGVFTVLTNSRRHRKHSVHILGILSMQVILIHKCNEQFNWSGLNISLYLTNLTVYRQKKTPQKNKYRWFPFKRNDRLLISVVSMNCSYVIQKVQNALNK